MIVSPQILPHDLSPHVQWDNHHRIAVLIPCYNEEQTIGKVVSDFRKELPGATIYVYDNNSQDNTAHKSLENGAVLIKEPRQGKGNVVRSMFRNIDADIYILVDGDDTYPAEYVHKLIKPILDHGVDMVMGDRISNGSYGHENKRMFHNFGNLVVLKMINILFETDMHDIMTGYRAFNRFFVKNTPILSSRFEVETEMTIHALDKKFLLREIPITYRDRPKGSTS
ncbi:MAG: glycosyltransferase family 2 protein, partial [Prevotella sp.]|nr:glycosyltransferase family 2 protein [Prevotella sp.]